MGAGGEDNECEGEEEAYMIDACVSFCGKGGKVYKGKGKGGRSVPKNVRKLPNAKMANSFSLNGAMKSFGLTGIGRGGMRLTIVRLAMTIRPKIRNAQIRIVDPKPTSGISFSTMMGKMTPPSDEPEAVIPKARARRLKNQVTTADMDG